MDKRQLSEFRKLVENSQEIAIVPSLRTRGEALVAGLALLFSLDNFGRKTSLLINSLPVSTFALESHEAWQSKPAIVINSPSGEKISQLRYEKNNGRVYLHFNSHDLPIREEDVVVSFSSSKSEPDLFICLGFSDISEIKHPLFQQRKESSSIVNIGLNSTDDFGQINFCSEKNSLTEAVIDIINSLSQDLITQKVGAYLLKGLKLYNTPSSLSNELCRQIAQLVNQEALSYTPNPCTPEDIKQLSLLEKSLELIDFYPQKNIGVLSLDRDLSQSVQSHDLVFIIDELRSRLLNLNNLIVLWQPEEGLTQGIIYLEEKEKLEQFSASYPGHYQAGRGVFNLPKSDLSVVKNRLTNYILSL